MQGVLLESGSTDRYLALGKSGHPVFDSSQQILVALQRHPQLQAFFAIPQRNEKGSVIDWYSPIHGAVIPWANASESEKENARKKLLEFSQSVQQLGVQQIEHGKKKSNADIALFGELLQEACKIPGCANIYLVEAENAQHAGGTEKNHISQMLGETPSHSQGAAASDSLQPVLTFWGFADGEDARHRKPLYFLEPLEPKKLIRTGEEDIAQKQDLKPEVDKKLDVLPLAVVVKDPWWKRWWWLLAIALLLLLTLWLLRACAPTVGLSAPTVQWPPTGISVPKIKLPEINVPGLAGRDGEVVAVVPGAGTAVLNGGGNLPGVGVPDSALAGGAAGLPHAAAEAAVPQGAPQDPLAADGAAATGQPLAPPALPESPAGAQLPENSAPAAAKAPLQIPKDAADGVADFLNGKYQTRGGLVDKDTSLPLQLKYEFENGKGQVEIQRSNGVSCKGSVLASMTGGQLGIDSQGAAKCSDNSSYDMPKVSCKAGATSVADCMGAYGQRQMPIQMQGQ